MKLHDTVKSISIEEYDKLQESLAMLKLIAQGRNDIDAKRTSPLKESFKLIRAKIAERKASGAHSTGT